ncbi:MAG: hypothetical protein AB7F50_11615 [Fimbriimonadaceae bacterium]
MFGPLTVLALVVSPVDWVLTTEEHVTEVKYYEQGSIHNSSTRFFLSPLAFTLDDARPYNITGNTTQDPPTWAAWLRPCPHYQTNLAFGTVPAHSIPWQKALYFGFNWDREHGLQGWSPGGDLELQIFRNGDKHTNPVVFYAVW